jgi:hypothetical protein
LIDYDDSSENLTDHITNLTTTNNGAASIVDAVLARREANGADFACLLVYGRANSGSTIGIAFGRWGSVVEVTQDSSTFAHELGHSFGCAHQRDPAVLTSYNHGFSHTEAWDLEFGFVMETRDTIMYSTFTASQRTDYFSNPNIDYLFTGNDCGGFCANRWRALGDASANNARYLRENRYAAAALHPPRLYVRATANDGNATSLSPENDLPEVYSEWHPLTQGDTTQSATVRLAPGSYPAPIRVTQKSRLERWGLSGQIRIGP